MKTHSKLLCLTLGLITPAIAIAAVTIEPLKTKPAVSAPAQQTFTFLATIAKYDYRNGTVVLQDRTGRALELPVAAKSGIDLRSFKTGDTVEATIVNVSVTDPTDIRTRTSKTELLKIQKK